jgi:hypothetical protein
MSVTLEDIFYRYDNYGYDSDDEDNLYTWVGRNLYVEPTRIGNHCDVKLMKNIHKAKKRGIMLNRKNDYMKIGETCAICLEPIFFKRTGYLTDCGHPFHKACIANYHATPNKIDEESCPICRQSTYGHIYFRKYSDHSNTLDRTENITYCSEFLSPLRCYRMDAGAHFVGMNKHCDDCQKWRIHGEETGSTFNGAYEYGILGNEKLFKYIYQSKNNLKE